MKQIKSAAELKNNHKYFLDDNYVSFIAKFVESKNKAGFGFVYYCGNPMVYRARKELFEFLKEHSFKVYEVN